MKTYGRAEASGQLHAPLLYYPWRNSPRYMLDRRLDGPIAGLGSVKYGQMCCPCRESKPESSAVQTFAVPTKSLVQFKFVKIIPKYVSD
jgi:hypothetical protein